MTSPPGLVLRLPEKMANIASRWKPDSARNN
jgi:hypothetical protein